MKYFIDTEFIEKQGSIDLISIGIVCENGNELYEVSSEFDASQANDWVKENVLTTLGNLQPQPREKIAQRIRDFVGGDAHPEFWGYFCDYDWVVMCWLYGSMMDLPTNWPNLCLDVKQLSIHLGIIIRQDDSRHNALDDARWIHDTYMQIAKKPR